MTRYEKISVIASIVATVIAVLTPFVTYYWLDPKLQELRHKRALLVDQYDRIDPDGRVYFLHIENPSDVPAADVNVAITTTAYDIANPPAPHVTIYPASPYDLAMHDNVATVTLKRVLGAKERMEIYISEAQSESGARYAIHRADVYSEIGLAVQRNHIKTFIPGGGKFSGNGGGSDFDAGPTPTSTPTKE
jgi:hypothetical protein